MEDEKKVIREVENPEQHFDNRFNYNRRNPYSHNNWMPGIVVIIIGIILLISRIPQTAHIFPNWFFDWPMLLIAIGIFSGARHGFRHFFWLIPIIIGIYFILKDQHLLGEKWDIYALPLFLILLGIFILSKRGRHFNSRHFDRRERFFQDKMRRKQEHWQRRGYNKRAQVTDKSGEDFIDINSVFGNSEKTMFTKTFKGGNISSNFGGSELNLSQADIEDTAVLNITVTFGGVDLIVPANWTIQNELSAVLGGIEDKRRTSASTVPPKILILRGNIICGGVEIKN